LLPAFAVIIFVVPTEEIRMWVLAAYDEGLWESGEYVLVYTNQAIPEQAIMEGLLTSTAMWQQPEGEEPDGRDQDVATMMRSMIMVSAHSGCAADDGGTLSHRAHGILLAASWNAHCGRMIHVCKIK
jgi:hypothetical protein